VQKVKAEQLAAEARAQLDGGCTGTSRHKLEDAAELLDKAANHYKLAKMHMEAAEASKSAGELLADLGQSWAAAQHYAKAAKSFKMSEDDAKYALYMNLAVELWTEEGRFSMAAKALKDLGEEFENDQQFAESAASFHKAAEYYDHADSPSTAASCRAKAANCLAYSGKLVEASAAFAELAAASLKRDLGKYKYDEFAVKSAICHLANEDTVGARKVARSMTGPTSQSARYSETIIALADAMDQGDVDDFEAARGELRSILEPLWQTLVLAPALLHISTKDGGVPDFM